MLNSPSCDCPITNGFWVDTVPARHECSACSANCLECTDATACTLCGGEYILQANACVLCPTGEYKDSATTCDVCMADCDECTSGTDCTMCSSGFVWNGSICEVNTSTVTCHLSCSSCEEATPNACTNCLVVTDCFLSDLTCGACPPSDPVYSPDASIEELATLTFSIAKMTSDSDQNLIYRISFSDGPIVTQYPYNFQNIETWLDVKINSHSKPSDYTYSLEYNEGLQSIDITFEIHSTI